MNHEQVDSLANKGNGTALIQAEWNKLKALSELPVPGLTRIEGL